MGRVLLGATNATQFQIVPTPDLSQVKVVFFDLDDTLCGYWDAVRIGLERAYRLAGSKTIGYEVFFQSWVSAFWEFCPNLRSLGFYEAYLVSGEETRNEQMRLALHGCGIDDATLAARLGDAYLQERNAALTLFADVRPVLNSLTGRYRLGLMTNGPADVQRQEIAAVGLNGVFDPILIEGELGFGKPRVEVFRQAERLVGLAPDQILMVGNSWSADIRPALAAGWHAFWVRRASDVPIGHEIPEEAPECEDQPGLMEADLTSLPKLLLGSGTD